MTKQNGYTYHSQSNISLRIERLIKAIQRTDGQAFRITYSKHGDEQISETRLSKYFDGIEQMVALFEYDREYQYSWHLNLFRDACQAIWIKRSTVGITCLNEDESRYLSASETLNELTTCIRSLLGRKGVNRQEHVQRHLAIQQEIEIGRYVDAVLDRYARTCVVRVDLYYRPQAQARLRVEQVFDDLDRLIAERERNLIFDNEIGYICSVEQGEDHGYHIHAAFFFNGAQVSADIYRAQRIGELWERITRGQGYFNNCNLDKDKDKYEDRLGIGLIHRKDLHARGNVHYTMGYLVKNDQHLRLKPIGARCLRKGQARKASGTTNRSIAKRA
ncbi:YagK/YfjJ domain-containing protein [Pseudomonas leptonychotis]|uniref:Inovirus Gp2 family protein n=1 Tax=Pseudomonas leptonychotis TaxID=2448482 RepID=A0A4T1ZX63_9PSED|nr:inovirus-type Gp2 protein [Pseudomonas leptonychotis]TIH07496.1 inovirus Gp2 family protein [Pseudomonas leptonychotis]